MESSEDILARITPIFQEVFDDDDLELRTDMSADDIDGWDSVTHIRLIVSHEMELGVKFDTLEINELKNIGDFVDLLKSKLK